MISLGYNVRVDNATTYTRQKVGVSMENHSLVVFDLDGTVEFEADGYVTFEAAAKAAESLWRVDRSEPAGLEPSISEIVVISGGTSTPILPEEAPGAQLDDSSRRIVTTTTTSRRPLRSS